MKLPTDAQATGYRLGAIELYVSPSDDDRWIYVVGPSGRRQKLGENVWDVVVAWRDHRELAIGTISRSGHPGSSTWRGGETWLVDPQDFHA